MPQAPWTRRTQYSLWCLVSLPSPPHTLLLSLIIIVIILTGSLLCVVIVACNLFVARVLWVIGRSRTTKRHMQYNLVNREKSVRSIDAESSSGTTLYSAQPYSTSTGGGSSHYNMPPPRQFHHSNSVTMTAETSPDEIKFAKLMAFLSISFVICWMPQMVSYRWRIHTYIHTYLCVYL